LLLTTILLSILLIISACGNEDDESSNDSSNESANENSNEDSNEGSKEQVTLKVGHIMPTETAEGIANQYFADLIEENSNGEIKVEVFPSEQLGNTPTQVDNVIRGTQDMFIEGSSYW